MDKQSPVTQSQPRPLVPAPPRGQAAERTTEATRQTFAQTLDRAQRSHLATVKADGPHQREVAARSGELASGRRGASAGQDGYQDDQSSDMPATTILTAQNAAAPLVGQPTAIAASAIKPDVRDDVALQRMAAAIAEIAKSGSQSKMTVDFSHMAGFEGSAIIGRDGAGAITVHIVAPPQMASDARFGAQLLDRLLKRKLNVSSVDFLSNDTLTEGAVGRRST
jgi:hypothetical protein